MAKATKEWLDSLRVGDKVVLNSGRDAFNIFPIEEETAATFTVRGKKFRKSNGEATPKDNGKWDTCSVIEPVTEEIKLFIRKRHLVSKMFNWVFFDRLNIESLEKMNKIVEEDESHKEFIAHKKAEAELRKVK